MPDKGYKMLPHVKMQRHFTYCQHERVLTCNIRARLHIHSCISYTHAYLHAFSFRELGSCLVFKRRQLPSHKSELLSGLQSLSLARACYCGSGLNFYQWARSSAFYLRNLGSAYCRVGKCTSFICTRFVHNVKAVMLVLASGVHKDSDLGSDIEQAWSVFKQFT